MNPENKADELEARLTAYAFGELEGEELAKMDAAVAADPLLAMRVEELRAFGDELATELQHEPFPEPVPASTPDGSRESFSMPPRAESATTARDGRCLRFPIWAWAATGLATAACVAVLLLLRERAPSAAPSESIATGVEAPPFASVKERVVEHKPDSPPPVVPELPPPDQPAESLHAERPAANPPEVEAPRMAEAPPAPESPLAPALEPAPAPAPEPLPPAEPPALVARSPAPAASPSALVPVDDRANVIAMLDQARGQYAAGDLDGAAASFERVTKLDAGNRQARYFSARIEQDRGRMSGKGSARSGGHPLLKAPSWASAVTEVAARPGNRPFEQGRNDTQTVIAENEFVSVKSEPVSTFAVDVDTGGYSELRNTILRARRLPSPDAIRIEELINYFPYGYALPPAAPTTEPAAPFALHLAVASAPWAPENRLVRIALKGAELPADARPPANLVFLVDISGSMGRALSLVKFSLKELAGRLRPDDRVAIVAFESKAKVVLPSTLMADGLAVRAAIDALRPKGGTNGAEGIELAYQVAAENFQAERVNRVILCSDGLFNIGPVGREELLALIRGQAASRVYLTTLGFDSFMVAMPTRAVGGLERRGNATLELLADNGNGIYGYVDSPREALKIFADQVDGTLATIAKDVKIQVAFDPVQVDSYRLIGYENRALSRRDFEDESADAGEIGAGHTITALYEVVLTAKGRQRTRAAAAGRADRGGDALLTVEVRHQTPEGAVGAPLSLKLADKGDEFKETDPDFKFAAAVAALGLLLREGGRSDSMDFADVQRWAEEGLGSDPMGYRAEFVELVRRSRLLRR